MKKNVKLITEILAIIVICLVSFVGIYQQRANKMKNTVKDYSYSSNLSSYRELVFKVSDATEVKDSDGDVIGTTDSYSDSTISSNSYEKTDTKVNNDEALTLDNYKIAKDIIEKRLKEFGVKDYNISLNETDGSIYLQIPDNTDTDHILSNILQVGKFELRDSEDKSNILISNDDIKKVSTAYNTETSGTVVYMQFEFDKNGRQVLKDISSSGDYVTNNNTTDNNTTTDSEDSNTDTTGEESSSDSAESTTQKEVTLAIDYSDVVTTSFDSAIEDGIITLTMNQATTDTDTLNDTIQSASTIALVLNNGKMPLTYKISENQYVQNNTINYLKYVLYVFAGVLIILAIILIVKFKLRAIIAIISFAGFIAINLLLVRYTNVEISIQSIVAAIIVLIINYVMTWKILKIKDADKEIEKINYRNSFIDTIIKLIPVFIIAIVFTFANWIGLVTFGMFLFWGVILSIIYNYCITKNMLD